MAFVDALLAARSGSESGFDALFDRFGRSVFLLGVFECYSNPERLVDDVLGAAFIGVDDFVGSEPAFAGQLFNSAMDRIVEERLGFGSEIDDHILCGQVDITGIVDSDRILDLHDSLHWLSDPERRAVHLRVTFGLNLLQTARVLETPVAEVRTLQRSVEQSLGASLDSDRSAQSPKAKHQSPHSSGSPADHAAEFEYALAGLASLTRNPTPSVRLVVELSKLKEESEPPTPGLGMRRFLSADKFDQRILMQSDVETSSNSPKEEIPNPTTGSSDLALAARTTIEVASSIDTLGAPAVPLEIDLDEGSDGIRQGTPPTGYTKPLEPAPSTGLGTPPSLEPSTGLGAPPSLEPSTGLGAPPSLEPSTGLGTPPEPTPSAPISDQRPTDYRLPLLLVGLGVLVTTMLLCVSLMMVKAGEASPEDSTEPALDATS